MATPRVTAVAPGSPAADAGIEVDDEVLSLNGRRPRDVIEYHRLVDEADPVLEIGRGGRQLSLEVTKGIGQSLGIEVDSALFDQVRTCDNRCEFCFIHQLPAGLRESLYLKDDDYRLSFLYGNFTTLTRFTESDLERVVAEGLSPLNVSIHATDPEVRAGLLRNRRGATSLRWLRALLDHGVRVHGQIVVCPGLNDGAVLQDTLVGVLDDYPDLATLCVVPLGVSRYNREAGMRPHTTAEAGAVLDLVAESQEVFTAVLGRRLVHAADEYYLLADRAFPPADTYEGFPMHEDGVGMARTFELELTGAVSAPTGPRSGFFAWVDGAPADGYRAHQAGPVPGTPAERSGSRVPVTVLTGTYGRRVLEPLIAKLPVRDVQVLDVDNRFFGGNVGVAGLLVGEDLSRVLDQQPSGRRFLLPDACLSRGRFLDGTSPADLPRPVEVVPTDGLALRAALEA